MPRAANPNSNYSKRKARIEFQKQYANMTPEEKSQNDKWSGFPFLAILALVFLFAFLFGGEEGLSCTAKWATR